MGKRGETGREVWHHHMVAQSKPRVAAAVVALRNSCARDQVTKVQVLSGLSLLISHSRISHKSITRGRRTLPCLINKTQN